MKRYLIYSILLCSVTFGQNIELKNDTNRFDYVIITINEFLQECNSFKSHKQSYNNFEVLITTKNAIIAEFNEKDNLQENIREFISYAGSHWSEPKPEYFLFAADVDSIPNFSFKSIKSDIFDIQDTSHSDYYYGVDIASEDSTVLNYAIGRIAARNSSELANYFNKVIAYENSVSAEWNNRVLFIADDEYAGEMYEGNIHLVYCINSVNQLPEFLETDIITSMDSSEYSGDKYSIIEKINEGESSLFFVGHGENEVFTHESLFVAGDVELLNNTGKPFFASIVGAQQFSRKGKTSIVNEMILSDNGALASINSVGAHFFWSSGTYYNSIWNELHSGKSLGRILMKANNNYGNYEENRKYNIFGDPSLVLKSMGPTGITYKSEPFENTFELYQNYPNPFNPSTVIKYSIPFRGNSEIPHSAGQGSIMNNVTLKVYDILGREIATLVNENQEPGNYEVVFNGSQYPSGVYFYELASGTFKSIKKMMLIK